MNKIERLFGIILALNRNQKLTAQELANKFEVSVRTIYRDIQALSQLEVPIISHIGGEEGGGYSLASEFFVSPIVLNREEVLSLALSEKIIGEVNIPGYTQYINNAFLKIRNTIDKELEEELFSIQSRIVFDISNEYTEFKTSNIINVINKSMQGNNKVFISYFKTLDTKSHNLIIHPYGLLFNFGIWKLIAYSEISDEIKIFRVDRINEIRVLDDQFKIPSDFSLQMYYQRRNYSCNILNKGRIRVVVLKIDKFLYQNIRNYMYIKHGDVQEKEDHYIVRIGTTKPQDFILFTLQFYEGLEILEPEWLRKQLLDRLKKINDLYN